MPLLGESCVAYVWRTSVIISIRKLRIFTKLKLLIHDRYHASSGTIVKKTVMHKIYEDIRLVDSRKDWEIKLDVTKCQGLNVVLSLVGWEAVMFWPTIPFQLYGRKKWGSICKFILSNKEKLHSAVISRWPGWHTSLADRLKARCIDTGLDTADSSLQRWSAFIDRNPEPSPLSLTSQEIEAIGDMTRPFSTKTMDFLCRALDIYNPNDKQWRVLPFDEFENLLARLETLKMAPLDIIYESAFGDRPYGTFKAFAFPIVINETMDPGSTNCWIGVVYDSSTGQVSLLHTSHNGIETDDMWQGDTALTRRLVFLKEKSKADAQFKFNYVKCPFYDDSIQSGPLCLQYFVDSVYDIKETDITDGLDARAYVINIREHIKEIATNVSLRKPMSLAIHRDYNYPLNDEVRRTRTDVNNSTRTATRRRGKQ
jgi:hypothetical protein